jgi:hypothetical protein
MASRSGRVSPLGERGSKVKAVCRSCGQEFELPRLAADPEFYNCCAPCLLDFPTADDPPCPSKSASVLDCAAAGFLSSVTPASRPCLAGDPTHENHPAAPAMQPGLLPGLVHDVAALARLFSTTHVRSVPATVHESLHLRLPAVVLVNLGVVEAHDLGRWRDGVWTPGPLLWREL